MYKYPIYISEDYLEELIKFQSSKLVGKLLKRFEICNNKDFVKKEAKELIYESYRDFQDLILAYSRGLEIDKLRFNMKGKDACK